MPPRSLIEIAPIEIISLIIDDLQGMNDVKACSLTCKALLPICRRHIFRNVRLDRIDLIDRFVQLITGNPAITDFVYCLSYHLQLSERQATSSQITFALNHLTRIGVLCLSGHYRGVDWLTVEPSIQYSLLRLMHLPTVVEIGLMDIKNFSAVFFLPCSNLKELSLSSVQVTAGHTNVPTISTPASSRAQLKELTLSQGSDLESALALCRNRIPSCESPPPLDLRNLEKIELTLDTEESFDVERDVPLIHELMNDKNIRALKNISIDVPERCGPMDFLGPAILPFAQTLEYLNLFIASDHTSEDPYAGLCQIFEQMAGKNQIKVIDLQLQFFSEEKFVAVDGWRRLETTFLAPGQWPALRQLKLWITYTECCYADLTTFGPGLRGLPESHLQQLSSSKSLDFNFSVHKV